MRVTRLRLGRVLVVLSGVVIAGMVWSSLHSTEPIELTARAVAEDGSAPSPHVGAADGSTCPAGTFCAVQVGNTGGCSSIDCCGANDTVCGYTTVPGSFPKLKSVKVGQCWAIGQSQLEWCTWTKCGSNFCGAGCEIDGSGEVISKFRPAPTGDSCGSPAQ